MVMVTWRVLSIQFRAQVPTTSPAVEVEVGWGGGSTLILSLMVVGSYPPWMDGLACPLLPEALGGLVQLVRVVGELFLKALAHMFLFVGQSFLSCNNKKMC